MASTRAERTVVGRICMLANADHTTHPIIRRQLTSLGQAGYHVAVVDQGASRLDSVGRARIIVRVQPVSLQWLAGVLWRVLRRIDEQHLGEPWWTMVHFLQVFLTGLRYGSAAVRQDADFYQAHDLETLLPAIVAGRVRHRPIIYDAHELTSEQGDPHSLRKAIERWLEIRLVPMVDYLVTPNASRAEVYARRCRLRHAPIIVRNYPPTLDVQPSDLLRQELGLTSRTRLVVYHGALIDGRALDNLVASVREYDSDIALVVIGEQTPYFHTVLEPLARSTDVRQRIHFVPFVSPERVLEYVASADLGVVIYQNINLNNYLCAPTKLYEYLMVGLPVVVSAFPEMLELLHRLPVGRAFNPDDASSIAAAINVFFRTWDQQRSEIQAALRKARRQFTWEQESRKLLEVFARGPG